MTTGQSLGGGKLSANMRGILLMIAATMLLTTMSSIVRIIAEAPTEQAAWALADEAADVAGLS